MKSLVVPVYRNEETIEPLLQRLEELHREVGGLECVLVVDGSPDRSHAMLEEGLADCTFPAELVHLSRNFGSFAAIRAGLAVATGPHFAVMAADLQEPAEVIVEFFRALDDEPVDLVVARREERDDPRSSRWAAGLFWGTYCRFVQPEMPRGGVDVFGCNRAVRDALLSMEEAHSSLVGQLIWLGFRRKVIPYTRVARVAGVSAWTLRRRITYMLDSMFSFTDLPMKALGLTGVLGSTTTAFFGVVIFVQWLRGKIDTLGYTPLMLAVLFSTFLLVTALAIVGNYVWRTYENTKRRPLAIPMDRRTYRKDSE